MSACLFAWSPGDDHAVPWPFVRLLGEPPLNSERSVGTTAASVDLYGTGIMDVGSSLVTRAVCGSRRPGALVAGGTKILLGRIRHID